MLIFCDKEKMKILHLPALSLLLIQCCIVLIIEAQLLDNLVLGKNVINMMWK